eukprot:TRINITY_DN1703_c1_g2_i2.p2 TRINITY_DN1703_c1_g2~~TRINITY_DN1703_c1_g2_i2.p2  ORF type:complete len:299 (+),score=-9.33 TRINITY_DN1703_c1_g2_i2:1202-2098(+)
MNGNIYVINILYKQGSSQNSTIPIFTFSIGNLAYKFALFTHIKNVVLQQHFNGLLIPSYNYMVRLYYTSILILKFLYFEFTYIFPFDYDCQQYSTQNFQQLVTLGKKNQHQKKLQLLTNKHSVYSLTLEKNYVFWDIRAGVKRTILITPPQFTPQSNITNYVNDLNERIQQIQGTQLKIEYNIISADQEFQQFYLYQHLKRFQFVIKDNNTLHKTAYTGWAGETSGQYITYIVSGLGGNSLPQPKKGYIRLRDNFPLVSPLNPPLIYLQKKYQKYTSKQLNIQVPKTNISKKPKRIPQ